MAKILPIETVLPVIDENVNFSFNFDYELDSNEILDSITIKTSNMPEQININGKTFSGNFSGLFQLPKNSLKYRMNDQLYSTDSFSKLPQKGTFDLYSYSAPSEMLKTYDILVEMNYKSVVVDETGTNTEEVLNISKWYKQPVEGNWSTFMNMFLNYVR